jgi:hypothetical protein
MKAETASQEYKVNNNHSRYFARYYMTVYPQREGFFELRGRDSEEHMREFLSYIRTNYGAEIWQRFQQVTDLLYSRGIRHYSADSILHIIRFHHTIQSTRPQPSVPDMATPPVIAAQPLGQTAIWDLQTLMAL